MLLTRPTAIVALAIAEALFRWHTSRTFDRDLPEWAVNLVVVRGAQVFAFKPHVSGEGVGSVDMKRRFPYRTNAHGLRDRDRPAKASGTKRVLVVGDAATLATRIDGQLARLGDSEAAARVAAAAALVGDALVPRTHLYSSERKAWTTF